MTESGTNKKSAFGKVRVFMAKVPELQINIQETALVCKYFSNCVYISGEIINEVNNSWIW